MFVPQRSSLYDSCWISSLATISGIDVELLQNDVPPKFWMRSESITGSNHILTWKRTTGFSGIMPWRRLMEECGFRMRQGKKSPKGVDFIQCFTVLSPSEFHHGLWNHAIAVNGKTGEVHDVALGPIETISELDDYCNIIPVTRFWLEEI